MRLNSRISLYSFVLISMLVTLVIYWYGYDKPTYGIDDANIYFVYMKHLAQGHGFVWNIGSERVEGFTSLLWTLIGALFYKLSGEGFVWLLFLLGFILTFFTVCRVLLFVRRCNGTLDKLLTDTDVIIMALLLFPLGFLEWNIMNLMETGLWLFLIVNLTLELADSFLLERQPSLLRFCLLLAILIPTRPESIAYGLLFLALFFVRQLTLEKPKKAILLTVIPALTYGVTLAALIGWRLSYFGYPFPNTYYAKVSASTKDNIVRGFVYLHTFFYEYPQAAFAVALSAVSAILLLLQWKRQGRHVLLTPNDKAQALLFCVIAVALAIPVLTGGDHFIFARFYQCILPLLYASTLNYTFWNSHLGHFAINSKPYRFLITAALCFGIFFVAKATWYDFTTVEKYVAPRVSPEFFHARNGRTIAGKENETFAGCSRYPSVGILAAGGFAYIYKGYTVDLMGLNSTLMAHAQPVKHGVRNHASFDVNTFWKLLPDMVGTFYGGEIVSDTAKFILPENTDYFRSGMFVYKAYKQLFDYPRFIDSYLPALVRNKQKDDYIFAYYHRPFLDSLSRNDFEVILLQRKLKPWPITP
jgi:arabinofuranosyltransferase